MSSAILLFRLSRYQLSAAELFQLPPAAKIRIALQVVSASSIGWFGHLLKTFVFSYILHSCGISSVCRIRQYSVNSRFGNDIKADFFVFVYRTVNRWSQSQVVMFVTWSASLLQSHSIILCTTNLVTYYYYWDKGKQCQEVHVLTINVPVFMPACAL